jgi:hypothetical protein
MNGNIQYKNPNNHNGILLPKPTSISSAATKAFSSSLICPKPLFCPPISNVATLPTGKSLYFSQSTL